MGERRGTKALELWCRRITEGYPGVNVQNMTTSWRDGLAFCAMIHHFRPDLIDFNSLDKEDIYGNNELAFRTAEQQLGIPALLDAEDMTSCTVPDRLSILTYLSQFYQVFAGSSPSRSALNRPSESPNNTIEADTESPQTKVSSRLGIRREPCSSCGLAVFLAEKLVVARSVYHRSCFRCARCEHQLTPGNYYETEDGQYCCEACPIDDEPTPLRELAEEQQPEQESDEVLDAPLSDEEKSKRRSLERLANLQRLSSQEPSSQSDEEKSAMRFDQGSVQELAKDEFDQMIKLISERIDQLETPMSPATSPTQAQVQLLEDSSTVHKTVRDLQIRRASLNEEGSKREPPALRRSSSLRSAGKDTKDRSSFLQTRDRLQPLESATPNASDISSLAEFRVSAAAATEPEADEHQDYPDELNPFASEEATPDKEQPSTNPFDGSDEEEEEEEEEAPKPLARTRARQSAKQLESRVEPPRKRLIEAPQINLNPFWSDGEEPESGAESEPELRKSPPVPKPRTTLRHSHIEGGLHPRSNLTSSSIHSSNTSIASSCSTITPGGTYRKKKPAPPPPIAPMLTPNKSHNSSVNSNPSLSPRLTPRTRKSKAAPPPPIPAAASTPQPRTGNSDSNSAERIGPTEASGTSASEEQFPHVWDEEKLSKDEANRNTQSLSCTDTSSYLSSYAPDKSFEGKWKRKKGPAPARPTPLRRKIKVMSMKDVKLELDQIEMQQQGLERQGVRLEQIIRDKCESGTVNEDTTSLEVDVEELVLELFALVNEKNELFRRQAELMLIRRQQRLEEEHADIEYQVRCLITQPEATKTDFDKQREEALIQRLVEIVERRNEIVECLEMDRKREIEEDRSIHREMDLYAARNKSDTVNVTDESRRSWKLKKNKDRVKDKAKERKSKKSYKKDADKDVDETETKVHGKRHTLRKWF